MKPSHMFPFFLCPLLAGLQTVVSAYPTATVHAVARRATHDVYAPPIIKPSGGEVLTVGQTYRVKWDSTSPPAQITNKYGSIKLRKGNYTMSNSLAKGFDILLGSQDVVIPNVVESDDYRIVLFGDSGNWSEPFRIVAKHTPPSTHSAHHCSTDS